MQVRVVGPGFEGRVPFLLTVISALDLLVEFPVLSYSPAVVGVFFITRSD